MTLFQSILLGIVQGLTEFLPISSSGHLVITPYLLGWEIPAEEAFVFDVLVQVGTLFAVIAYFWRDLYSISQAFLHGLLNRRPFEQPQARMGWYLLLATVPASLAGLWLKDLVASAFDNPQATAFFLLGTASLLLTAEKAGKRMRTLESFTWKDSLWMGLFQILALFPGLSRSGATITGGMVRDLDRPSAARFSFLMSVPVMLAAGVVILADLMRSPQLFPLLPPLLAGCFTSALVGYLSIHWLLGYLTRRPLYVFTVYCVLISLLVLSSTMFGAL